MSDPNPPPECPACKVVINGRRISGNAAILADVVDKMMERDKKIPAAAATKIVGFLNDAEDLVDAATRELVRMSWSGPVNKALADS